MPKNLLDHTHEELQDLLAAHLPLRPDPGRPISDLTQPEYRDHMKALEAWNDRKSQLELGVFLTAVTGEMHPEPRTWRNEIRSEVDAAKALPAEVQAPSHIQLEPIQETPMPNPILLPELVQRYTDTLANMPALEGDEEAWTQAKKKLYDLRYKIKQNATLSGLTVPVLPAVPPSPFSTQGVHKRAQERPVMPEHVEPEAKPKARPEPEDPEDEEVTLQDLVERIRDCRQELGSILSDAQLLERSERAHLSIDMTELVILANGVDAALTPHQLR